MISSLQKRVDSIRSSRGSPDSDFIFPAASILYSLDNEVRENSNFFMFQKAVEVPFQVCACLYFCAHTHIYIYMEKKINNQIILFLQ